MQVTYAFDLNCPWTWITSRWLVGATAAVGDELRWHPLSLAHLNEGRELPERVRRNQATGRRAHRAVQWLLERDRPADVAVLYEAYGTRVHRRGEERTAETLLAAIADAGLDDGVEAATQDATLDAAVDAATEEWVAAAGGDGGSPVIRFGDGPAFFGPLLEEVPGAAEGQALYRALATVTAVGPFISLQRGRPGQPRTSTS